MGEKGRLATRDREEGGRWVVTERREGEEEGKR